MAISINIEPFEHRCTIQSGDLAGNDYTQEVTSHDVQYGVHCHQCHCPLGTTEDLILHMYAQLTGE